MIQSNRSIPSATVIPVLSYTDINDAAKWLCTAFGFRVRLRIADHRIQMFAGPDGAFVIRQDDGASAERNSGHAMMIRVADANAHFARAVSAGATVMNAPTDYPYGERQYTVTDIGGHSWTFSESIADVDPASWGGRLEEAE